MLLAVASILFCSSGSAQIFIRETTDLRLVYLDPANAYLIPHTAASFENSLAFYRRTLNFIPSEKVTILLHDFHDYGTGGTNTIPWDFLSIGIEPYDYAYETSPTNERMNWVMNHELMHVVATDKATGADRLFRDMFFGKVVPSPNDPITMMYSALTSPRWYSPRWYHEGLAVFWETWMAGGIGRALGPYDEMVFRTMVADSGYFYDYVGLESEGTTIDFQVGANAYLYGTRFISYLALMYGPEKLKLWLDRKEGSARYYAAQFEDVYGVSLRESWSRWISWEHEWQHANLDSVRQYPVTKMRPLTDEPLGSVSRAFCDTGRGELYVALNRPGHLASVAAIDLHTGNVRPLAHVVSPALYYVTSLAFDPSNGSLFYTTHNSSGWRSIRMVNAITGDDREILHEARIGDLAFDRGDGFLWGVQHHNGYSTLVCIPPPYESWTEILPLKYGKDLFDLDISPDGSLLTATMIEINGRQQLITMHIDSLRAGNSAYEVLHEFKNCSPMNFVFSADGRYLYGSTSLTGVANVVRYDFENRTVQWLTNVETGLFHPLSFVTDSLIAFRYTAKGFLPVAFKQVVREDVSAINFLGQAIVDRYPVVTTWKIPPPSVVNIDSLTTFVGEYHPWDYTALSSAYPVIEGYKDVTTVGARSNFQDILGVNSVMLRASYSPSRSVPRDERLHAAAELRWWEWKLSASYNAADFYDLFGPTKTSRKGVAVGIEWSQFLIFNRPRTLELSLSTHAYTGLDRLPDYQNVAVSFDRFLTFNGRISYAMKRRSLGGIDDESGIQTSLAVLTTVVRSEVVPRVSVTFDTGVPLPLAHSSVWLRTAAGWGGGQRDDVFGGFFFGGFGNNWVDHAEPRRYRETESFPGIELNGLGGKTFVKSTLEWTLPPLRFKEFGVPAFYCTWAWLGLFASGVTANFDRSDVRTDAVSVGAQVDFKLVLFSHLDSFLSLGYAGAAERGGHLTREFMISLKLL
jgi:hypothetical protein